MGKQIKYILTGNEGLIGQFLDKRLQEDGNQCVMRLDKQSGFDVNDLYYRENEMKETPDVFIHMAAQCKINEAIKYPFLPHRNNVDGILAVLEFCRKHKIPKIVAASTSRVLSKERNPYVASKVYVEELVKAYHDCYGLEYLIIRPSTVYGPCYDNTSRLMNTFIARAIKSEPLKIYGDRNKTLDFTYVDDFVDGVMLAMKGPWNKEYNISGANEEKIYDVAKEIIRQTSSDSEIQFHPPEIAQPQQVKVDISEIQKIGYNPKIGVKEGIKRVLEWHIYHPNAIYKYEDKGEKFYNNGR